MTKRRQIIGLLLVLFLGIIFSGCEGPESIGRFRATPITNIILEDLGVVDEDPTTFSEARAPLPRDLVPDEMEYVIGVGDVLDISIHDLLGAGMEWRDHKKVSDVGRITIPEIGTFRAVGKTELELTETIHNLVSPRLVKNPTVTVSVFEPRKKVYSIAGAISYPGPYMLVENDYRISRALAAAGGIPQSNVDYAYVIRTRDFGSFEGGMIEEEPSPEEIDIWSPVEASVEPEMEPLKLESRYPKTEEVTPVAPKEYPSYPLPVKPKALPLEQDELLESITPMSVVTPGVEIKGGNSYGAVAININLQSAGDMSEMYRQAVRQAMQGVGGSMPGNAGTNGPVPKGAQAESNGALPAAPALNREPAPASRQSQSLSGWRVVRKGNRFELVPDEGASPLELELEERESSRRDGDIPVVPGHGDFVLPKGDPAQRDIEMAWEEEDLTVPRYEVIKVDLKKLRGGDWTQNIVVRSGDDIQIPFNATGIYSVMGQISRPGAYNLSGSRTTLKQAISSAGPLTALACTSRCEIIRRIGDNKEVTYLVNLDKLFAGTAPDLFIKPNDIINVGSHPVARWAAVLRQSFRSTYGFGFVYDRNFADKDIGH